GSAAAITVAVSGATIVTSPRPNTIAPGNTSVTHEAFSSIRDSMINPTATTSGPTVNCSRGPIRCASAPELDDSTSIKRVAGNSATPASSADQPAATCNVYDTRKNDTP